MEIVADLHLHSKYSRAVSPQMVIPEMAKWAKIKGIDLLGTGDFTHPLWLKELQNNLEGEKGIFFERNKVDKKNKEDKRETRFILTGEISCIYSQGGKTRKIHTIIIAPSFSAVEKINKELSKKGCNLKSDGRPIIGMSAKDLLDLTLGVDDQCLMIPAHIWTPWFSLYGSKSGFDSIQECFGELSKYIYAVETGLSSDPEMNWQVPDLDKKQIVSFSDAHSGSKLGREATVLEIGKLRYEDIRRAIVGEVGDIRGVRGSIKYTIEFYPEEGKYHWTGHRKCGIVLSPEETAQKGTSCPVCGKSLTIGVGERVKALGDRARDRDRVSEVDRFGVSWTRDSNKKRPPFVKLVPLAEIIAETLGVGESSQKVQQEFEKLIKVIGSEIKILIRTSKEEIAKVGGDKLAEGIMKVRKGDIYISPGFDGEFGKVSVWPASAKATAGKRGQDSLF